MKSYIIGVSLFIVFAIFTTFQVDYNKHQEQRHLLKYFAEEAAAAAAQFTISTYYKDGYLVFNQSEGDLAARRVLKENMSLDENFLPFNNNYWMEQIDYMVYYCDDLNTDYPYKFNEQNIGFEILIKEPTVVVIINAGKAKYSLMKNIPDIVAVAAHEWQTSLR